MKTLFLIFTGVLLLSGCAAGKQDVSDEIKKANTSFIDAFNANDAKALSEVYTSNARLFPANSPSVEGREAIKEFWGQVFGMGIARAELNTREAESFGDTAIEEGSYTLYDEQGNTLDDGKYIVIWKKEDGKWHYHKDIWNTNRPAAN